MSDLGPKRFLYIVGTSYTGSTLLSFLLILHPREQMPVGVKGHRDRRVA